MTIKTQKKIIKNLSEIMTMAKLIYHSADFLDKKNQRRLFVIGRRAQIIQKSVIESTANN